MLNLIVNKLGLRLSYANQRRKREDYQMALFPCFHYIFSLLKSASPLSKKVSNKQIEIAIIELYKKHFTMAEPFV